MAREREKTTLGEMRERHRDWGSHGKKVRILNDALIHPAQNGCT